MDVKLVFQSTRPVRDATILPLYMNQDNRFQSTRPVRDATIGKYSMGGSYMVSIHASRAGRDLERVTYIPEYQRFNPRVPCGTRL